MDYLLKICDPVHGFIRFGELEKEVIDSRPFQRLRYIHQMGVAYLVYPGATHTRFEHSLGVMELSTRILNSLSMRSKEFERFLSNDLAYWTQILRLAALCHDMGHLPFSHTAEQALLPKGGHEQMTLKIIRSDELRPIWNQIGKDAEDDIIKLAVSKSGMDLTPAEKLFAQIITEDNFGADRIDYLIRDAYYTGVGYGHFDHYQLIDSLRVLSTPEGLSIGVTAGGIQSVESLWIARYMMYSRVYRHPKARVYTKHMNRFMERYFDSSRPYLEQTDFIVLNTLLDAAKKGDYDAQVLLKMKPAYEEVEGLKSIDLVKYGENVFIDIIPLKKGQREFPVLSERGDVIPSSEVSPFLSKIPVGGKSKQIYVHPDFRQKLQGSVESLE